MKLITKFCLIALITTSLSGCLAAAVGAGAAGGAYIEKNYDVSFKMKKKKAADTNTTTQSSQAN